MSGMWNSKIVILLLTIVAVIADALVLVLATPLQQLIPNWTLLAIALAYSQIALVATWVAWGRGPASLRFAAALGIVFLLADLFLHGLLQKNFIISPAWSSISPDNLRFTLFVLLGVCLGEACWFQFQGWRLMLVTDLDVDVTADTAPVKPQFSIAYLFILTTLVALVFGVARHVHAPWGPMIHQAGKLMLLALTAGAPVMVLMWSLLAIRDFWFHTLLGMLFTCSVFVVMVTLSGLLYPVPIDHSILVMITAHLMLTVLALLALRACGYRLLRMYDAPKSRNPASAD